jgi:hypothetical protein
MRWNAHGSVEILATALKHEGSQVTTKARPYRDAYRRCRSVAVPAISLACLNLGCGLPFHAGMKRAIGAGPIHAVVRYKSTSPPKSVPCLRPCGLPAAPLPRPPAGPSAAASSAAMSCLTTAPASQPPQRAPCTYVHVSAWAVRAYRVSTCQACLVLLSCLTTVPLQRVKAGTGDGEMLGDECRTG